MAGTARACRAGVPTQSPARGALDPAPHSGAALIDPEHAGLLFGKYAEQWLQDRVLKVRTAELYQGLLRNHLLPTFRTTRLSDIDEAAVRYWRKERLDIGARAQRPFGPVTVAKAYRLLHAIFETAVDDQMVRHNPCRIEGGGRWLSSGAGEGNRTLMTSLEGWGSAIELRPRWSRRLTPGEAATRVAYRLSAAAWSADGRH